jgi:hypothetical protein
MHSRLKQRVDRLEKRSGVNYVLVPLPHDPDRFMRLPLPFAEFMAQKGEEMAANGPPVNLTTEACTEIIHADGDRQNPTE